MLLSGEDIITKALSVFEKVKVQLQAGIDKCNIERSANCDTINALHARNDVLDESIESAVRAFNGINHMLHDDVEVPF